MTKQAVPSVAMIAPDGEARANVALGSDRVSVGRAMPEHSPDIALGPDPQRWISRLHCTLEQAEGGWFVVDNGSVNGTVVERNGVRERVDGRHRLLDGDFVLVLGYLVDDEPFWWRLRFRDPFATAPGPAGPRPERAHLEYSIADAKLFVVVDGRRAEVTKLGPNRHKLVRYMASRNAANGAPVACTQEELIEAVWGDPRTWPFRTAYTADNLRDLIFELRRKLRPHEQLLETVQGFGYTLRTTACSE